METPEPDKSGLNLNVDLVGLGKVAKAIPPEVYKQGVKTVLKIFESLVAPLTQTTEGFGRLMRQKFDNMVDEQKVSGIYMLKQAVIRAETQAERQGKLLQPPHHPKTFLRALEEGSLETDSLVHEMWVNLLASQLIDRNSHPHFISILSQLGPDEAKLLAIVQPYRKDPRIITGLIGGTYGHFGGKTRFVTDLDQPDKPWNLSATILCQHNLAKTLPLTQEGGQPPRDYLHLTPFGVEFLAVVAPPT